MAVRAIVRNGRLLVDEPTDLPEGTVIDLVLDDEGDDLEDAERGALAAAITASLEQARAGRSAPAETILSKLRARRDG